MHPKDFLVRLRVPVHEATLLFGLWRTLLSLKAAVVVDGIMLAFHGEEHRRSPNEVAGPACRSYARGFARLPFLCCRSRKLVPAS